MEDIKDFGLEELKESLLNKGYPRFLARQVFSWIYGKRIEDFSLMTDISRKARKFLENNFYISGLKLLEKETSIDGTEKFLFRLRDNSTIETVLIPEGKRNTLCISTQVGCRFRCAFCVSGINGFKRNLKSSEITGQYLEVSRFKKTKPVTNIVFMGIGEPLDNFDNLVKSIGILTDPSGISLGKKRICISTVGIIPELKELIALNLGVKLSVSLHSADAFKREKLMPIAKKYPLDELIKVVKDFCRKIKVPLTFEYILIGKVNSSRQDALKLAKLTKNINCKVNIIPYNPSSYFKWLKPSSEEIEGFSDVLRKYNLLFTLRKPKGWDINAACGQLRAKFGCK